MVLAYKNGRERRCAVWPVLIWEMNDLSIWTFANKGMYCIISLLNIQIFYAYIHTYKRQCYPLRFQLGGINHDEDIVKINFTK